MSLLEVEGLRVGYGFPVLMGISFTVEEGETAVMFGLNGAGKTTTVATVAGLLKPDGGTIRFDGADITKTSAAERSEQMAGTLSGGEQQMLAIARALMSRPRLLLVDEASLGLSPALTQTVFSVVDRINNDGVTVVLVEQNVGVLPYADRALIMEKGTLVYQGSGDEIHSGSIRETYLGTPA
jgi:branched-chain amino acid transport system ATP-binding protein